MSDFFTGSICLDDIPAEFKTKGKNGKTYVNYALSRRKKVSDFGETHTMYVSKPKDQRKEGEGAIFIGGAKEWNQQQSAPSQSNSSSQAEDDLPF